jgi:hypothetical protein
MTDQEARRVHRITAAITALAVVFCLFFQVNKGGPFRAINPFGNDPYDAIGSFAIQIALLVGLLTYARGLRLREERVTQEAKARLILRGNLLVLAAVLVTLFADIIAMALQPPPPSFWVAVLTTELGIMALLALGCAVGLAVVFRGVRTIPPPRDLTPADAMDDLWALARIPVARLGQGRTTPPLPDALVRWSARFNSDRLFAWTPWLDPRRHPWRFASVLGLLIGVLLVLAQLQEGLPPNLKTGLLVAAIFIGTEFVAVLVGFALLGGYLGLRPAFGSGTRSKRT